MKARYTLGATAVALALVVGSMWAAPVYGDTFQLHTVNSFVEILIEKGIVPSHLADKARNFAAMVTRADTATQQNPTTPISDSVEVTVSQLIQHADLTYAAGDDVEGLLLLATNIADEAITLEAVRKCQILYRIYRDEVLVYDRATSNICQTDERVTFRLGAGDTRMFEVVHTATTEPLAPGEYRVEIEYPGYGAGEKMITIE